jgi:hypothetical protein
MDMSGVITVAAYQSTAELFRPEAIFTRHFCPCPRTQFAQNWSVSFIEDEEDRGVEMVFELQQQSRRGTAQMSRMWS